MQREAEELFLFILICQSEEYIKSKKETMRKSL